MSFKAAVIGASGATGFQLVQHLCKEEVCHEVHVFVRKALAIQSPKLHQHIVDFDQIASWQNLIKGDVLFSAMGTTLKAAGSKEAQYKIDYTYQYEVAKAAAANGVKELVLVSAYGAKLKSPFFYSRMKAELEEALIQLPFERIHIFQPGILDREKADGRMGEHLSLKIIYALNKVGILRSQRPMPVHILAHRLLETQVSKNCPHSFYREPNVYYYRLADIF
ncbi:MAG: NAD(P)H-binding protein [Chitinophagales bacterium]|nr:NAD(P)H-binding protein [Chitinophagales bacterium]